MSLSIAIIGDVMTCSIEGCDKNIAYKARGICQMHYFRYMRNGSYEALSTRKVRAGIRPRKYRSQNAKGYQMLHEPSHPLAMKNGVVYEHRMIVYEIFGVDLPDCELCGRSICWDNAHVDHIDRDVTNNNKSNLRPLCRGCNTTRDIVYHERSGVLGIEWDGEIRTAEGWASDSRIDIPQHTIRRRIKAGWSVEDALFKPRITHSGKNKSRDSQV